MWLSLLLVLLIMGVIFYFSAQPVKQSRGTSDGFVVRLIKFFMPDFKSLPGRSRSGTRLLFWCEKRRTSWNLPPSAAV